MSERPNFRELWLKQITGLTGAALVVFWGFYSVDHFWTGADADWAASDPLSRYLMFDADRLTDAVSSLAGVIAAVFGIVITVVSIIVQLSANRYTGVTRMFFQDRLNNSVMAYYIIVCVCGVWLSASLQGDYVPRAALLAMLMMTTVGLVLMAPYFAYVFWFLEPMNIIIRIRRQALTIIGGAATELSPGSRNDDQATVLTAMEELTDITSNSISGRDKIIASGSVDALKDLAIGYLDVKSTLPDIWFEVGEGIARNPDFVAMDSESLTDLVTRRSWVEWKVLRQYLGIYNEALRTMQDINYLIAIDTRYIGEAAVKAGDKELISLVFRFMNSYLRATLNAKDVRTAYNVLNQYRLLIEAMLNNGNGAAALEGVKHMKYYGHVSFDMKLTFVTETAAFDVAAICELAHELGAVEELEMLAEFLELDRPLLVRSQEKGLLGVRKAQVKLAAYYLLNDDEAKALMIFDDMKNEPRERLYAIRQQLEGVESKDFWEIIDRGRNFEFMPAEQRECMNVFFGWMEIESRPSAPPGAH